MNQEDLNYMINGESWIYDHQQVEGIEQEISSWAEQSAGKVIGDTQKLFGQTQQYKDLMMKYTCAMKSVRTKFDILNTEFNNQIQRNPIKSISTRLKKTSSILNKLSKLDLEPSIENIENNIFDVAGVRVICSYMDDIYQIADALLKQDDIKFIQKKDYLAHPKPNGYRSVHLIVKVPVYFSKKKTEIPVEVQIRTIAMDFWATLEHQLRYKQNIPNEESIYSQLKWCADWIHATDQKMLSIRNQIEAAKDIPSTEELLVNSLSHLDINSSEGIQS